MGIDPVAYLDIAVAPITRLKRYVPFRVRHAVRRRYDVVRAKLLRERTSPQLTRGRVRLPRPLAPSLGLRQHDPRLWMIPDRYADNAPPTPAPTISIVTPSFNQGRFIEQTITSIVEQGYPHLEFVVQDGGSSDETPAVLERWKDRLHRVVSASDEGQAHAINLGFAYTTGDVMAYINSDDIVLPGTLAYVASYFQRRPDVDAIYGHRVIIDEQNREIGKWILPPHDPQMLSWADYVPQETLFWRRAVWERAGGCIDESFQFAMDWDLLVRFRSVGARIVRVPRFLSAFRVHDDQKSTAQVDLGHREMHRIRERIHGRPVSVDEVHKRIRGYLLKQAMYRHLYRVGLLRA